MFLAKIAKLQKPNLTKEREDEEGFDAACWRV